MRANNDNTMHTQWRQQMNVALALYNSIYSHVQPNVYIIKPTAAADVVFVNAEASCGVRSLFGSRHSVFFLRPFHRDSCRALRSVVRPFMYDKTATMMSEKHE